MGKSVLMLKLLDLLKSDSTLTAAGLAAELGRSERTIYRYLQELGTELNVPVYYEEGYKMHGRPRLAPINFTEEEVLALRMALTAAPIRKTAPLNQHAGSALRKVQSAMSEAAHRLYSSSQGQVSVGAPPHDEQSQIEKILPVVESAIVRQKSLQLRYQSFTASAPVDRVFDPYALAFRRHSWYLVGHCHKRGTVLQLRVSRISRATQLESTFQMPADFSLDSFYEGSWEVMTGDPVDVEILFEPALAKLIAETKRHPTQQTETRPDGKVIFRARVAGYEEIGWWVLSFGGDAEVLSPPEFREWMVQRVRGMAGRYLKD